MLLIKKLLLKLLGLPAFLRLVSKTYLILYFKNLLNKKIHNEALYLTQFIRKNWVCIDIGANLGYYSIPLGKLVGEKGTVYSVEPIPLFVEILTANIQRYNLKNIHILPYALGDNNSGTIQMGTPEIDGMFRHGYTKVLEKQDYTYAKTYNVPLRNPIDLFKDLTQLHFIKCDVEGYETHILPHFKEILLQFKPILQIEIVPIKNKKILFQFFQELGYQLLVLQDDKLIKIDTQQAITEKHINYYFIYETF